MPTQPRSRSLSLVGQVRNETEKLAGGVKTGISFTVYHHGQSEHDLVKVNLILPNRNREWLDTKMKAINTSTFTLGSTSCLHS